MQPWAGPFCIARAPAKPYTDGALTPLADGPDRPHPAPGRAVQLMSPHPPCSEADRLAALHRYDVLDTEPEQAFDDLTRLAAYVCQAPYALIVFVDASRQWVKSAFGLTLSERPRSQGFCARSILSSDLTLIEDALLDPAFAAHPMVAGPPGLRAFAGAPILSPDGFCLGVLCVADTRPRILDSAQQESLRMLSRQVMSQLELRRNLAVQERLLAEHRLTRIALADSESFYRTLVDSLPQHIIRKDRQGRFTFANHNFCALLNLLPEEVLGRTDHDLFPEALANKFHRDDLRVISTGQSIDTIEANQTPDGQRIHVHVIKTPLHDARGEIVGIQGIFWDVTERRKIDEALAHERDLLRALLDNTPDRIFFKDVQSRITRCSKSLAVRLGLKNPDEIIGKTDFDFYPEPMAREFFNDEQRIILTRQPLLNKTEHRTGAGGAERWVSVSKVPIYNQHGVITGLIGISHDITRLIEAERALEHARDAALQTARIKSEFLANMSHEIRTPMNTILGVTGLLIDTPLNDEQLEYAETIRTASDNLLEIITDILDLSKIEAGKLQLETIDFDLRQVVEETAELLAVRAHSKGLELVCCIDEALPTGLRGDPKRLQQILANLLSNAVKFTERGEVCVRVELDPRGAPPRLRFSVTDTGIGIPPGALELIFQPFTQADGSTTRKYGGTGLGLAICKQITDLFQGEIGVQSAAGQGSTFWFSIPMELAGAPRPEPAPERWRPLEGLRVLIVEDHPTNRQVLLQQAAQLKMEAAGASESIEAHTLLQDAAQRHAPFHIALVDLELPGLSGAGLVETLKDDPLLSTTRLIALSSLGGRLAPAALRALGISACLVKPVRQSRFREALLAAIGQGSCACDAARRAPAPSPAAPAAQTTPLQPALRVLLAEDNPVNQRLAVRQIQKLGHAVDAVFNGLQVLEALARAPYDVLLLDGQMPEMDGYETARSIRLSERLLPPGAAPLHIVALTANALDGDRQKALDAGMDDYLAKPVKTAELDAALRRSPRRPAPPAPAPPHDSPVDLTILESLKELRTPGQPDPVAELAGLFLRDAQPRLERMDSALQAGDTAEISAQAHSLKGSANNLGARALGSICARIEQAAKASATTDLARLIPEAKAELARVETALAAELVA